MVACSDAASLPNFETSSNPSSASTSISNDSQPSVEIAPSGDAKTYPIVQEDFELYVDADMVKGNHNKADITNTVTNITTCVNGYVDIVYNVDDNFTANGIEKFSAIDTSAELVKFNENHFNTLEGFQMLVVRFGTTLDVANVVYVIEYKQANIGAKQGVRQLVVAETFEKVDGVWKRVAHTGALEYAENQQIVRNGYSISVTDKA